MMTCVTKKTACADYTTEESCIQISETEFCDWTGSACEAVASDTACNTIANTNASTMCNYKTGGRCTYVLGGGGC